MASETLASIEKFLDSESPDKILALADSSGALQELARDLSQVAVYANEVTFASTDMSAAFNLSGQQIQVLSPLLLDLAGLMGKDIPEASLAFWEAMQIGTIEPLKAFGLIVDESRFKTDAFGTTLDALSVRALFASQVMGEIFVGQLAVLNDALNETCVIISEGLIPRIEYLAPLLSAAARDLERISAAPTGANFTNEASGRRGVGARDVVSTIADVVTIASGGPGAIRNLVGAGSWLVGRGGLFGGAVSWGAGAATAGIGLAMYGAVHGYDYWATRKRDRATEEAAKPDPKHAERMRRLRKKYPELYAERDKRLAEKMRAQWQPQMDITATPPGIDVAAPAFLPEAGNSFDLSAAGVGNSGAFDSATEWLLPNGGKDYYSGFDMPQMSQYSPRVILQRNGQGDYTIRLTSDLPIQQEWFDQQVEGFADQMAVAPGD
jgi:hypothetical protein